MKTLRPLLASDARLGFWEYQLSGLQVTPGTGPLAEVKALFEDWLAKPENASPAVRLPSAFLGHGILLKKAWPAQQAGLPGSRLHQLSELMLKYHLPRLSIPEDRGLSFWRDWEQSKVDPQTLVFSTRSLGVVGQTMENPFDFPAPRRVGPFIIGT